MKTFENLESEVRGYCRNFPTKFTKAKGETLWDDSGETYLDFLSGAGSLNYGHNPAHIKAKVLDYLNEDGVLHGLDLATAAKEKFLATFQKLILAPRNLEYKMQFPGPTGTNAVEAALKLARKVTGRSNVVSFTNGFHGMTLGSVAATGNSFYRDGAGMPLNGTQFMPFDGYFGKGVDTLDYFLKFLTDNSSGMDLPAAVIVESVQGEGGINVASGRWLKRLEGICRKFEILMIIDDIQVGCGRTGDFFSFESFGIQPDLVTLSKSLSGFGLPLALLLIKPELDQWEPGEHNGTFRGNNLAFISATAALENYWQDDTFSEQVKAKGHLMRARLERIAENYPEAKLKAKGRGMIQGLESEISELPNEVSQEAFARNMIIETSGADSQVAKCLPPLNISEAGLLQGLDTLEDSIAAALKSPSFNKELKMAGGDS